MNIKRLKVRSVLGATIIGLSLVQVAAASDLVVTALGKGTYSFDFVNSGDVSALDFQVSLPKLEGRQAADIDACVAGLPSSHRGGCAIKNGALRLFVYSPTNAVLETTNIGRISVNGRALKGRGSLSAEQVHMFGPDAAPRDFEVLSGVEK